MTGYIYEKDLFGMKYRILISPNHDRVVTKIADCLGIKKQDLRKYLIENLDMAFLENIPARYSSWVLNEEKNQDNISKGLCMKLLTQYIPLLKEEEMAEIFKSAGTAVSSGVSEEDAILKGKEKIREVIFG